jgi:DNA-binding response OmpR family regulator
MVHILLADDEQELAWMVRHSLKDEGYEVLTAFDGLEALAVARRHRPDLAILDITMPLLDGLGVCQRLRRDPTLAAVPILFLIVRGAVEDRIRGLDGGGDDYLTKPFEMEELKARVRALLRRSRPGTGGVPGPGGRISQLTVGPITLDLQIRQARVGNKCTRLTPTEFDLLHHLMTHPDEIFSSQQLLRQVWGYPPETADPGLVRWHIRNLRQKIEPDLTCPTCIQTVPRHGYILSQGQSWG